MAAATLPELHKRDLPSCTLAQLRKLTWLYYGNDEGTALVMAEYERRGIDPYA
jgi:hypothetical protein